MKAAEKWHTNTRSNKVLSLELTTFIFFVIDSSLSWTKMYMFIPHVLYNILQSAEFGFVSFEMVLEIYLLSFSTVLVNDYARGKS